MHLNKQHDAKEKLKLIVGYQRVVTNLRIVRHVNRINFVKMGVVKIVIYVIMVQNPTPIRTTVMSVAWDIIPIKTKRMVYVTYVLTMKFVSTEVVLNVQNVTLERSTRMQIIKNVWLVMIQMAIITIPARLKEKGVAPVQMENSWTWTWSKELENALNLVQHAPMASIPTQTAPRPVNYAPPVPTSIIV